MKSLAVAALSVALLAALSGTASANDNIKCVQVPAGMSLKKAFKEGVAVEMPMETCALSAGWVRPSSESTSEPTTEPAPEVVIALSGGASADFEPTERSLSLDSGSYILRWEVREPFPSSTCGVTASIGDATGDYAGGVPGVSRSVLSRTSGEILYPRLASGEYELFAYIGCPWDVRIVKEPTSGLPAEPALATPAPAPTSPSADSAYSEWVTRTESYWDTTEARVLLTSQFEQDTETYLRYMVDNSVDADNFIKYLDSLSPAACYRDDVARWTSAVTTWRDYKDDMFRELSSGGANLGLMLERESGITAMRTAHSTPDGC